MCCSPEPAPPAPPERARGCDPLLTPCTALRFCLRLPSGPLVPERSPAPPPPFSAEVTVHPRLPGGAPVWSPVPQLRLMRAAAPGLGEVPAGHHKPPCPVGSPYLPQLPPHACPPPPPSCPAHTRPRATPVCHLQHVSPTPTPSVSQSRSSAFKVYREPNHVRSPWTDCWIASPQLPLDIFLVLQIKREAGEARGLTQGLAACLVLGGTAV